MEYTVKFAETDGICMVHVSDRHQRPDDSLVLKQFARDFNDKQGCSRFLFDMSGAEIIGDIMDTFVTGTVPADQDHKQLKQKIALLYSGSAADHRFMENVAVNRGYNVRVFDQMD